MANPPNGDPTKPLVSPVVQPGGAEPVIAGFNLEIVDKDVSRDLGVLRDSRFHSDINVEEYKPYRPYAVFDNKIGMDLSRARGQSSLNQFGNMLVQAAGEVIGGTISGFGSMYEVSIGQWTKDNADFNNWAIELGENIMSGSKEYAPIHRLNPGKSFDFGDFGYWMEHAPSVASTLSLMIPGLAAIKGASFIGKLAGLNNKISKAGKALIKTGITAGVMRNAENFRESLAVTNQMRNTALQEFSNMNDEQFTEWLNSDQGKDFKESGQPLSREKAADYVGAQSGWRTYTVNSANIVFDIAQASLLFKGFAPKTRTGKLNWYTADKKLLAETGRTLSTAQKYARYSRPLVLPFTSQIGEGFEEGINYIGGEEGKVYGEQMLGTRKEKDNFIQRLGKYTGDAEFWESGMWGVFGGVAFSKVAGLVKGGKSEEKIQAANKIAEINNRMAIIESAGEAIKKIEIQEGEGLLSPDEAQEQLYEVRSAVAFHLGANAAANGNVDLLLEQMNTDDYRQQFAKFLTQNGDTNVTEEDIDNVINESVNDILEAERLYKAQYSTFFNKSGISTAVLQGAFNSALNNSFDLMRHDKKLQNLESQIAERLSDPGVAEASRQENYMNILDSVAYQQASRVIDQILARDDKAKSGSKNKLPKYIREQLEAKREEYRTKESEIDALIEESESGWGNFNIDSDLANLMAEKLIVESYKSASAINISNLQNNEFLKEQEAKLKQEELAAEEKADQAFKDDILDKIDNDKITSQELEDLKTTNDKHTKWLDDRIKDLKRNELLKAQKEQAEKERAEAASKFGGAPSRTSEVSTDAGKVEEEVIDEAPLVEIEEVNKELKTPEFIDEFANVLAEIDALSDNEAKVKELKKFRSELKANLKIKDDTTSPTLQYIDQIIKDLNAGKSITVPEKTEAVEEIETTEEETTITPQRQALQNALAEAKAFIANEDKLSSFLYEVNEALKEPTAESKIKELNNLKKLLESNWKFKPDSPAFKYIDLLIEQTEGITPETQPEVLENIEVTGTESTNENSAVIEEVLDYQESEVQNVPEENDLKNKVKSLLKDRYYNKQVNRMVKLVKDGPASELTSEDIEIIEAVIEKAKELKWDHNRLMRQLNAMGYSYAFGSHPEGFRNYLEDRLTGQTNIKITSDYNFFKELENEVQDVPETVTETGNKYNYANHMVLYQADYMDGKLTVPQLKEIENIIENAKKQGWNANQLAKALRNKDYKTDSNNSYDDYINFLQDRLTGKTDLKVISEKPEIVEIQNEATKVNSTIEIPKATIENKDFTIAAAEKLNELYPKDTTLTLSLNDNEFVIKDYDTKSDYSSPYYNNTLIPLAALLDYEINDNPHTDGFNQSTLEPNTNGTYEAKGSISLKENKDIRASYEMVMKGPAVDRYIKAFEKYVKDTTDYKKTGFKDIEEATRSAYANMMTAKVALMKVMFEAFKEQQHILEKVESTPFSEVQNDIIEPTLPESVSEVIPEIENIEDIVEEKPEPQSSNNTEEVFNKETTEPVASDRPDNTMATVYLPMLMDSSNFNLIGEEGSGEYEVKNNNTAEFLENLNELKDNLGTELEIEVSKSTEFGADPTNWEKAMIPITKNGKIVGYIPTIAGIKKAMKVFEKNEEFSEKLKKNLAATIKLRKALFNNPDKKHTIKLKRLSSGVPISSDTVKDPREVFVNDFRLAYIDPKQGVQGVTSELKVQGSEFTFYPADTAGDYYNHNGRYTKGALYLLTNGLSSNSGFDSKEDVNKKIPIKLKVNTLTREDATNLGKLIKETILILQAEDTDLGRNSRLNEIRKEIAKITPYTSNNVNSDGTVPKPVFKIHRNTIEILYDNDTKLAVIYAEKPNRAGLNYRIATYEYKGKKGTFDNQADYKKHIGERLEYFNINTNPTGYKEALLNVLMGKHYSVNFNEIENGTLSENDLFKRVGTDVGVLYDKAGNPISNFIAKPIKNEFGEFVGKNGNLELGIDTDSLEVIEDSEVVEEVKEQKTSQDFTEVIENQEPVTPETLLDLPVKEESAPTEPIHNNDITEEDLNKAFELGEEDADTDDFTYFMMADSTPNYEAITPEERSKNWKSMFGDNVEFDPNIERLIYYKGKWAYGLFNKAAVQVSKLAPRGTEFHEGFHVVMHLYLKDNARQAILEEARKVYPQLVTASDRQVEEKLAEDFRKYKNLKEENRKTGIAGLIQKFFDKLLYYITNVVNKVTGKTSIDNLFRGISSGAFNYKPSERMLEYAKTVGYTQEVEDLEKVFTPQEIDDYVNYLSIILYEHMGKYPHITVAMMQNNPNKYSPWRVAVANLKRHGIKLMEQGDKEAAIHVHKVILNMGNDTSGFWVKVKDNVKHKLNYEISYDEATDMQFDGNAKLDKKWDDRAAFASSSKESFDADLKRVIMATIKLTSTDFIVDDNGNKIYTNKSINNPAKLPVGLDFNKLYPFIQSQMVNANNVEEMLARLKNMADSEPSFALLYDRIVADPLLKNKWFTNFNKAYLKARSHKITPKGDGYDIKSDVANKSFSLANHWISTLQLLIDSTNKKKDNAHFTADKFTALKEELAKIEELYKGEFNLTEAANILSYVAKEMGINIPAEVMVKLASNPSIMINGNSEVTFKNLLQTPISLMFNSLMNQFTKGTPLTINEFGRINDLAELASYYLIDSTESSYYNTTSNLVYSYAKHSFLSDFFDRIERVYNKFNVNKEEALDDLKALFAEYMSDPSFKHSNWLWGANGFLKGTPTNWELNLNNIKDFKFSKVDGIKNTANNRGAGYAELADKDWDLQNLFDYLSGNSINTTANFTTLVQADSGNNWNIESPKILLVYDKEGRIAEKSPIFDAMRNTIRQELARMKQAKELLFNPDGSLKTLSKEVQSSLQVYYHYNGFNEDGTPKILDNKGNPTGFVFKFHNMNYTTPAGEYKDLNDLLTKAGYIKNGIVQLDNFNKAAEQLVVHHIKGFIESQIHTGIKKYSAYEAVLNDSISNKNQALSRYSTITLENGKQISKFEQFVTEFMLNSYLTYVEHANFFNGNVPEFKNIKDTNKRAKQQSAPGQRSATTYRGETYKAITIKDIKLSTNVLENIIKKVAENLIKEDPTLAEFSYDVEKLTAKKAKDLNLLEQKIDYITNGYKDINVADAQGYITLSRLEATLKDEGRWGPGYEVIFKKLNNGEELVPEDLKYVLQVVKPYYFARKFDPNIQRMRDRQVKTSLLPLIPQLYKGTEMEKVADYMNKNDVGELYLESAAKVGSGYLPKITDGNGKLLPDFDKNLVPVVMFNRYWSRQLDVADHIKDEKNKLGVQIAKIIFADLSKDNIYKVGDKMYNGDTIRELFFDNLVANIEEDAQNLLKRIGAKLNKDGEYEFESLEKIHDILVEELKSRNMPVNYQEANQLIKTADGKHTFNIPLFVNNMATKYQSILTGLFTNNITDQKFPGGHATIASEVLINNVMTYEDLADKTGIEFHAEVADRVKSGKFKLNFTHFENDNYVVAEALMPAWSKKFFSQDIKIYDVMVDMFRSKVRDVRGDFSDVWVVENLEEAQAQLDNIIENGAQSFEATVEPVREDDKIGKKIGATHAVYHKKGDNKYIFIKGNEPKDLLPDDKNRTKGQEYIKKAPKEGERISINDIPEEIRTMIGYRIPTEAKYSTVVFKIVGFLPEGVGSTIVMPYELVTQTGWDFDVDSLYMMQREFKRTEKGFEVVQYDESKTAAQNNRAARNNRIFDIYHSILTNPEHYKDIVNPGKFTDPAALKERQEKLLGINADNINPNTRDGQDFFRSANITGRALKGMAANANSLFPILQNIGAVLRDDLAFTVDYKIGEKHTVEQLKALYGDDAFSLNDIKTDDNQKSSYTFKGYKGGYDPTGKGTPQGDGKDAAMREIADSSIVEFKTDKKASSSLTTFETVGEDNAYWYEKDRYVGQSHLGSIPAEDGHGVMNNYGKVVMLARNGTLNGKPLDLVTKQEIVKAHRQGAEFVVGDMPNVDSQFIEYLKEIGATFTIYHTGKTSRIQIESKINNTKEKIKDKLVTVTHKHFAQTPNGQYVNSNGQVITNHAAQMLAMILDIVKEGLPYNINTYTFDTFMAMLGTGIPIEYAGQFIRQPILNSLANEVLNNKTVFGGVTNKEIEDIKVKYQNMLYKLMIKEGLVEQEVINKYKGKETIHFKREEANSVLGYNPDSQYAWTLRELEELIAMSNTNGPNDFTKKEGFKTWPELSTADKIEYFKEQLRVLERFIIYKKSGEAISDINKVFSTDKIGAGPSFSVNDVWKEAYNNATNYPFDTEKRGDEVIQKGARILAKNSEGALVPATRAVFGNKSSYRPFKAYLENSNALSLKTIGKLFIERTPAYITAKEYLYSSLGKTPSEKMDKSIDKFLKALSVQNLEYFKDIDVEEILGTNGDINLNTDMTFEEFTKLSTANQLYIVKQKFSEELGAESTNILNFLEPKIDSASQEWAGFAFIRFNKPKTSDGIDDYLIKSFETLINSADQFKAALGNSLLAYDFITTAMNYGKESYSNYIPSSVLTNEEGINLGNNMRALYEKANGSTSYYLSNFPNLVELFYRNNWNNTDIVPKVQSVYVREADGKFRVVDDAETGEKVLVTKNETPDWNQKVSQSSAFFIEKKQLKNEAKNIINADYLLITTKQGDEYIKTLVKKYKTGDKDFDSVYNDKKSNVIYYYPVTKLGGQFISGEYQSFERSVLRANNVVYGQSQMEAAIENLIGGVATQPSIENEIKLSGLRDNDQINCE